MRTITTIVVVTRIVDGSIGGVRRWTICILIDRTLHPLWQCLDSRGQCQGDEDSRHEADVENGGSHLDLGEVERVRQCVEDSVCVKCTGEASVMCYAEMRGAPTER